MLKAIITLFLFMYGLTIFPVGGYMFRIHLKDKGETTYTIANPEEFLSKRAIERRQRQNIEIDLSDLPISTDYINTIQNLGCTVVAKSKWLSTISIHCEDSLLIDKIKALDFVDSTLFVWKGDTSKIEEKRSPVLKKVRNLEKSQTDYGYSFDQIKTVNGNYIHDQGYKGKGIEIAVIDAGFQNLNEILLLDNVVIKGTKDFVYQGNDMFKNSDHGLKVLSVMATNRPAIYVGSAPNASYWLLRSEDNRSEYPIEEDYWIAAAEYADSIGVDIINTSLGYSKFNLPAVSYTQSQLNGKTAHITKAAEIAATKGILLEVSAGNEGNNSWKNVVVPSDAEHVLTVGSMTKDSLVSAFSSRGPTADGRIKPDVIALGSKIRVVASTGEIEESNGTSFAGPVISGFAACLWEAYPDLTNLQLIDILKRSAHKYDNPDNSFGYGIPDMEKALKLANSVISKTIEEPDDLEIQPMDASEILEIEGV